LFVTDFSDSSLRALQWAIPEAAHRHLHLSVLYAYRLDQARKVTVMSKKDMDGEAAEKFEAHAEKVLRKSGVTFEFHSEVGFIRDRVSEHAKRNNVVLVVMGEKIASAESFPELLREVRVPVVIVPSGKITSSLP
jgi:nucleotide-binding universal stress UspA family protein